MDINKINEVMMINGYAKIKHIKTGGIYYIKGPAKVKINGEWLDAISYFGAAGDFCRIPDDFQGFEYICNE